MINTVTIEGALSVKPVLLESTRTGQVTEFNLEHSDLTGTEPLVYTWRCQAKGELAREISEKAMKGQVLIVAGKLIQEVVKVDGTDYPVVKLRVEQCAFGRVRAAGGV